LTLVPWKGHSIVGTAHSETLSTIHSGASAAEIDAFIREANEAFPALALSRERITLVHWGRVPAAVSPGKPPDLLDAPVIHDHARDGMPGALTVVGVKYTTARAVAQRAVDTASARMGRRVRTSRTATTVLPGAGLADHEGLAIETARRSGLDLPPAVLQRLGALYAERSADIIHLMAARPDLCRALGSHPAASAAEIVHVITHEMALHLTDIVLRRTALGAAGHPGHDVVEACATVAASELGWTDETRAEEIAELEEAYRVP
jgi:glycerol-3-phosphate dehydrogenase